MNTIIFLAESVSKFLNLSNYKHILILISYFLCSFIIIEVAQLKQLVSNNSNYIYTLKKQAIFQFLKSYHNPQNSLNYIDLYFVSQYCIELMDKDNVVQASCSDILGILYEYKNK